MTTLCPSAVGSKLVACELCLDFANTVDWHASEAPIELLTTYPDLVTWSLRAGLLDVTAAEQLLLEAGRRPADAAAALERAIAVREAIYGIVLALLGRRPLPLRLLEVFNRELNTAFRHLRVLPDSHGLTWDWDSDDSDLDSMLWPILRSAAELLTSERRTRIGQCADDRGCGWLFMDTTKNRSRRWCDMRDCGNRAKARRHYRRSRASGAQNRTA